MTETGTNDLAEAPADEEQAEEQQEQQEQLSLELKVEKPSACERHVTVVVSREDVNRYFEREFDELLPKAEVPGFRPGRAPRKLVVNRFKEQVADQVKGKLLMDCMAQVSETEDLSPISEPDFDIDKVKIPDEGDMTFEFDVEVRPEFAVPEWKGLDLEEPVHKITDQDVDRHLEKILSRYGKLVTRDDPAEAGDYVTLSMTFTHSGEVLSSVEETSLPVKAKLSFRDAQLENFGKLMTGAAKGDTRKATLKISTEVENEELRGEKIGAELKVLKVEKIELPKLTSSFLEEIGGFTDEDDLREEVRGELERQQRYRRQQHIRRQITRALTAGANWELPPGLLKRQTQRELRRMVLELQSAGFSNEVIQAHANQLQQNSMAHTAMALKEHFILERIAEEEKFDAQPSDFDQEIELIAEQEGLPPRRIRARLEKRGEMDALRNQIIERKVIERITSHATVKEVPFEADEDDVAAIDHVVTGVREKAEIPEAKHADAAKPLPGQPDRG
jgi:trigger factor